MARYRYQRGDRPLDGFTIEHGLGVGGFGEVYYAVSDSGREVALKAVQNYEEIELRGIRHCMNLKSPHLVTVFDVRHNDRRDPFVIMEYVQGPSLRRLLDEAPDGIGPTKAAFFLREMAKGLTYLHDSGVVHRDLKPHNVFYEEGFVKIGDYSLCKLISTTHHTGHTMTVGTVHYMAPEISKGRYDSSVDIYALGVMLYEMLTGKPPFTGDSIGEVLMKHMTEEPDLSQIEEPFRSTVAKALAKQPEARFQAAEEMVESVFGVEHVQNSVVAFNPQELTMVAEQAADKLLDTPRHTPGSAVAVDASPTHQKPRWSSGYSAVPEPWRDSVATASGVVGWQPLNADELSRDAMPALLRNGLAVASVVLLAVTVSSLVRQDFFLGDSQEVMGWVLSLAGTMVVLFSLLRSKALQHLRMDAIWFPRLLIDMLLVLAVIPIGLGVVPILVGLSPGPVWDGGATTLLLSLVPFAILNWHKTTHPLRGNRLHFGQLLASVAIAFTLGLFFVRLNHPVNLVVTLASTVAMALGLQMISPLRRRKVEPVLTDVDGKRAPIKMVPRDGSGEPSVDRPPSNDVRPKPKSVVIPEYASPYARWPLVALAGVFFLFPLLGGLHRFYVGKRSSGIIWLCTLGLCGIGQIVDIVRILRGEFCDADGRPVLAWETAQAPATAVNELSSVPPQGNAATAMRNVVAVLGNVMFTASAVLAGVSMIARFAAERSFGGYREITMMLSMIGFGLLLASIGLLIHSRRDSSLWAKLRLMGAFLIVGLTLVFVSTVNFLPPLFMFVVFLPVAMALYAWPSSSSKSEEHLVAARDQEVLV